MRSCVQGHGMGFIYICISSKLKSYFGFKKSYTTRNLDFISYNERFSYAHDARLLSTDVTVQRNNSYWDISAPYHLLLLGVTLAWLLKNYDEKNNLSSTTLFQ